MSIRLATTSDEAIIAALRFEWTTEQRGDVPESDDFEDRFHRWFVREADQRRTWLAAAGESTVGMLNLLVFTRMPKPGVAHVRTQWGYVANAYVMKAHRDSGWGTRLMDACIAHATEQNFTRLVVSPSEQSIPLYERAGFAPATSLMVRSFN